MPDLEIQCFASLRNLAGSDHIVVNAPDALSVSELKQLVGEQYPLLAAQLDSAAVAVNLRVARAEEMVNVGDEIALLPPVSGG
jgi:molybdopterin converting factor subunit 1